MLETQKRVNSGDLSSDALLAYSSLQQKYSVYQRVVESNINYYLKENPGAWLVYETGYKKLFGFTGTGDVQDTLLAGLLCALCFSGLFAMERKGGMDEILACTPLGRKYTVKAKLRQSTAVLGGALFAAFCTVFAKAQLLPAAKHSFALTFSRKTRATSVTHEEGRKLLLMNGAAVFLAAFLAFGLYQGVTAESYIDADEIYYAYYMKHISGPWSEESRDWLKDQRNEFIPMLETQKRVNSGDLSSDALLAYSSLQQKYSVYQRVVESNINYYLKENPGAWLVYETGYKKLFGFTGTGDVQDTLLAGLLCALCFSGLFAMERKGGMDEILACTPLGRKYTVKAKLRQSTAKVQPWQRLSHSEPFCLTCGKFCVTMAFPLCWDPR